MYLINITLKQLTVGGVDNLVYASSSEKKYKLMDSYGLVETMQVVYIYAWEL